MDNSSCLPNADTTRPLSRQSRAAVLSVHELLREGAFLEVKVERVQADEPREQHILCLLLAAQIVAKNEAAFLGSVTVQVDVHFEVTDLLLLHDCALSQVHSGLLLRTRFSVEAIQVMVVRVETVVAAGNAVWINQRNELEAVLLEQNARTLGLRQQEVNDTVENVRALNFTWMNSSREEDRRLVKNESTLLAEYFGLLRVIAELWEHAVVVRPVFSLVRILIPARNCDQLKVAHLL